jgi:hypothetical protein
LPQSRVTSNLCSRRLTHHQTLQAQLLNIPTGVISILTFIGIGYSVRKTGQTCLSMIGFTIPNIVGTVVLLTVTPGDKTKGGLVFAWYLMQIFGAVSLLTLSWPRRAQLTRSLLSATPLSSCSSPVTSLDTPSVPSSTPLPVSNPL